MTDDRPRSRMADLIPDDDTLEVMGGIATVIARGDEPTWANVREAIRAQREWERSRGLRP